MQWDILWMHTQVEGNNRINLMLRTRDVSSLHAIQTEWAFDISNHLCIFIFCKVKLNEVVELILIDKGKIFDGNHAFYLHGHSFRVVAMERVCHKSSTDNCNIQPFLAFVLG